MKKLMIAVAIVCAAVISQAAQVKWSASGVKGYGVDTLYSGDATLHVLSVDTGKEVYTTTTKMEDGAISAVFVQDDAITGGKAHNFYYTMTDSAGNVFTSTTIKMTTQATATPPVNFYAKGSWAAVPEPTSGLLLLLGVGALALRRKQK